MRRARHEQRGDYAFLHSTFPSLSLLKRLCTSQDGPARLTAPSDEQEKLRRELASAHHALGFVSLALSSGLKVRAIPMRHSSPPDIESMDNCERQIQRTDYKVEINHFVPRRKSI
jgi:hypothetical protein